MHVTVSFDLELTEGDTVFAKVREAMGAHPPLAALLAEHDADTGIGTAPPAGARAPPEAVVAVTEIPQEAGEQQPIGADPEPQPAATRSPRAARARAATPEPAASPQPAEPETLTEPVMRDLLNELSARHPARHAQVVAILKAIGGSRRLVECPTETWPAIKAAAEEALAVLPAADTVSGTG